MSGGLLVLVDFQGENQEESSCWKVIVASVWTVFEVVCWMEGFFEIDWDA